MISYDKGWHYDDMMSDDIMNGIIWYWKGMSDMSVHEGILIYLELLL